MPDFKLHAEPLPGTGQPVGLGQDCDGLASQQAPVGYLLLHRLGLGQLEHIARTVAIRRAVDLAQPFRETLCCGGGIGAAYGVAQDELATDLVQPTRLVVLASQGHQRIAPGQARATLSPLSQAAL